MDYENYLRQYYCPRLETRTEDHGVVGWESKEAQEARFQVLIRSVPLENRSILDVGCGVGSLYGFLGDRGIRTDYTGIDILPEMTERARSRYPGVRFVTGDVFTSSPFPPLSFDVVFSSGLFNLKREEDPGCLERSLERLAALSKTWVIINLLNEKSPDKESDYRYYRPDDVRSVIENCCGGSAEITILDEYLPNDFSVVIRRFSAGGNGVSRGHSL